MNYIYLIQDKDQKIYVGYSSDLKKRIATHLRGKVRTTSRMNEPQLIYYEAYRSKSAARTREKKLKQYGSAYHGLIKRLGLK